MLSLTRRPLRAAAAASKRFLKPLSVARAFASSNSNNASLIINAVGQDRLGIVSDVTGIVIAHGGNVGESQAAKLGRHFSLMMQVSLPVSQQDALQEQLRQMTDMNATVFVAHDDDDASSSAASSASSASKIAYQGRFTLEGADNPGIVHTMTTALAKHNLNIQKMTTDHEIAPHGGTMLFRISGTAVAYEPLAATFDALQIRNDLQDLGASLNCDVELEELDANNSGTSAAFYGG